jgi:hypothetical protein
MLSNPAKRLLAVKWVKPVLLSPNSAGLYNQSDPTQFFQPVRKMVAW